MKLGHITDLYANNQWLNAKTQQASWSIILTAAYESRLLLFGPFNMSCRFYLETAAVQIAQNELVLMPTCAK